MKVLLSAYACEPDKGSEPEVGLQALLAAAKEHDVWALTRENNLPPLRGLLSDHPVREIIHLDGLDLPGRALRAKQRGLPWLHWYYDTWQRGGGARWGTGRPHPFRCGAPCHLRCIPLRLTTSFAEEALSAHEKTVVG